jgi:hypothetical protein
VQKRPGLSSSARNTTTAGVHLPLFFVVVSQAQNQNSGHQCHRSSGGDCTLDAYPVSQQTACDRSDRDRNLECRDKQAPDTLKMIRRRTCHPGLKADWNTAEGESPR